MTIFQAILLGVAEGLTEFLPVSSTAHLLLISRLLELPESEFVKSFIVVIQLGAIFAVIWLYRARLVYERRLWPLIAVAFLPTAVVGFILYKIVKNFFFESPAVILLALGFGGVILIWFENRRFAAGNQTEISTKQALFIGLVQSLAVIPGVSRAAATIVGGLTLGLSRRAIVEFSFLLAIPTMLAATGYDLLQTGFAFISHEWLLLTVGFVVSFVSALATIKFFLRLIEHHSFLGFGIYRLVLALGLGLLLFAF